MIIACIIVFNEERMLPGCLESIQDQVDRIVVVDGAFARYPHDVPYSTDATQEIAWCYGAEWIPCPVDTGGRPRAWRDQVEKRNSYLIGSAGDWYFIVDADERVTGRIPEPVSGRDYRFQVETWQGMASWTPRLVEHVEDIRYEGAHNALWAGERLVRMHQAVPVSPAIMRLEHLTMARDEVQQLAKRRYYAERIEFERPYRNAHGI